jgi:hypothetical protein
VTEGYATLHVFWTGDFDKRRDFYVESSEFDNPDEFYYESLHIQADHLTVHVTFKTPQDYLRFADQMVVALNTLTEHSRKVWDEKGGPRDETA